MNVKKVLGGMAWFLLAGLLILVNAAGADSQEVLAQTESVSAAEQ